jgi:hypothetical protein
MGGKLRCGRHLARPREPQAAGLAVEGRDYIWKQSAVMSVELSK